MKPLDLSSGRAVKRARGRVGWSQAEMAELLGVAQPVLSNLEARATISMRWQHRLRALFSSGMPQNPEFENLELGELYDRAVEAVAALYEAGMRATTQEETAAPSEAPVLILPSKLNAGRSYQRLTPQEKANNKFVQHDTGVAIARNRERDRCRASVLETHRRLKAYAAAGQWKEYHGLIMATPAADNFFLAAYLDAAAKEVLADDDPRVTLPLEPINMSK